MTASKEERDYRRASKKCMRGEMKQRLINTLVRRNTGLQAVEEFIRKERKILGGGNKTLTSKISNYKEERKIVRDIMRRKLREITKTCINLRRRKVIARESLSKTLGEKSGEYRRIVMETRKNNDEHREILAKKNEKKVKKTYGDKAQVRDGGKSRDERKVVTSKYPRILL